MPQNEVSSLTSRIAQLREYRDWARLATAQTGKSLTTQAREILQLKSFGGKCGITDYYWHKLYDDAYLSGRGQRDFLGWRLLQEFSQALNPRYAVLPAWDKIVFAQIANAYGLPVAPALAVFHRAAAQSHGSTLNLDSLESARQFLLQPAHFPLFGKPAFSQGGHGAAYLQGVDPATGQLTLLDGRQIPVEEFLLRLVDTIERQYHKPQCGFVFQRPIMPAASIRALTSWQAVCSVRVVCLNGKDGSRPIRAAWKIAVPPNHTDNFGMGDHGNLLADVDLETGRISKVIGGFWPNTKVHDHHPKTGQSLENFELPGWQRVQALCKLGGQVFPLMKVHHWDFALTDDGPVIMELNDIGGTQIPQMHGRGLLTESSREFLKEHGNASAQPWIKAL